jgi:translation initiation factor 2B subunit (eIF-2B alpha/beta/delta family)
VLVDAVAVGGDGVVVDGGAAVMVAAARVAGVRVFACAADFDVLPGGGDGEACIPALRAARGHPGRVMCYEDVVRSGARIRIVNPLWDFVRGDGFDVLVTSGGAIAAGRLGKLEGLGEAIAD